MSNDASKQGLGRYLDMTVSCNPQFTTLSVVMEGEQIFIHFHWFIVYSFQWYKDMCWKLEFGPVIEPIFSSTHTDNYSTCNNFKTKYVFFSWKIKQANENWGYTQQNGWFSSSRVDFSILLQVKSRLLNRWPIFGMLQWVQSALQSVQKMSTNKHDSQKLVKRLSQAAGEQSGISVSKAALITLMASGWWLKWVAKFLNSQLGFERGEGITTNVLEVNLSFSCFFCVVCFLPCQPQRRKWF